MELDDYAMAYTIGDVAGIALIFQQLISWDDMRFVDDRSARWQKEYTPPVGHQAGQRHSTFGSIDKTPLFQDNPKLFMGQTAWQGGRDTWPLVRYDEPRCLHDGATHWRAPGLRYWGWADMVTKMLT
ncbi:hypothetical protein DOTSEDRAFT_28556 [Dothistroma septosporum NZE10]|uniref:Uncharacterized protein n=1 Tax=Dothistroma septosporum (strain NZE10 / CBS 128990) TaxID=675120 RepID=M2WKB1_DOTSN|nr:hypothetical protein DOTSEDRAFT_28556 [Dothistroma septosporum NZE10]